MRTEQEGNAINRVLRAWGMGALDEPGTLAQMGYMVDDHQHFSDLLRKCEPQERRNMYEAMRPYLRFKAFPLDAYDAIAAEQAAAAQLPVIDSAGNLQPYTIPAIEVPEVELYASCRKCGKEGLFYGDRKCDAVQQMRHAGWAWDELFNEFSMCPECLEEAPIALHSPSSEITPEREIAAESNAESQGQRGAPREPEARPCEEGHAGHEA